MMNHQHDEMIASNLNRKDNENNAEEQHHADQPHQLIHPEYNNLENGQALHEQQQLEISMKFEDDAVENHEPSSNFIAPDPNAFIDKEEEAVEESSSCGKKIYEVFVGFLFPRLTPIPWTSFLLLSFFVALP